MIDPRDYIATRRDPRLHSFTHGDHPWFDPKCAKCGCPRFMHTTLLGRLMRRLFGRR